MSDSNDNENGRPAGGRAPLTLKPRTGGAVSSGMVKQSFSHGRSKTVVVETKRRRVEPPVPPAAPERRPPVETRAPAPAPRPAPSGQGGPAPSGGAARQLSEDERRARQRVIEEAARAAQ